MAANDKKSSTAPAVETKTPAERTKTVLVPRVSNVLHALSVLENCADKTNYQLDAATVKKVFDAIESKTAEIKTAFNDAVAGKTKKQVKQGFDL